MFKASRTLGPLVRDHISRSSQNLKGKSILAGKYFNLALFSINFEGLIKARCMHSQSHQQVEKGIEFKISNASNHHNVESNIELDDLEVSLPSGEKITLNLTWLRNSCNCDLCRHKSSRQRLLIPKDFKRHLFKLSNVSYGTNQSGIDSEDSSMTDEVGDDCLKLTWSDGHESIYSVNWLCQVSKLGSSGSLLSNTKSAVKFSLPYDDVYLAKRENTIEKKYWQCSDIELVPVDYEDLMDGLSEAENSTTYINSNLKSDMSQRRYMATLSLTNQLVRFGLAKITGVPEEKNQVLKVARSLAYERPTGYGTIFNVVVEPSDDINLAYSSFEFDLHTDLPYRESSPGVQLLHCIKNSVEGGYSYFADAFWAAQYLRDNHEKYFDILCRFPVAYSVRDPYRNVKLRRHTPILSLDCFGNLKEVHYNPFLLPPIGNLEDIKLYYLAIAKFTQLLQSKNSKMITKMNDGDLFIFNNRRVLHGRSSYSATSSRFLQGCYMDWDEIEGLQEKLNTK